MGTDTKPSRMRRTSQQRRPSQTGQPNLGDKKKFVKLQNHLDGNATTDTLHRHQSESVHCNPQRCMGSIMNPPLPVGSTRSKDEILGFARDFFRQFFESKAQLNNSAHNERLSSVEAAIFATGHYDLTEEELLFAAKTAWRNSQRCIARIQWQTLKVFDARNAETPQEMFEAILRHIKYAGSVEGIPSAMTVFRHRTGPGEDMRIWNAQLIKYAGYRQPDGTVIGDGGSVEFTEVCERLGWKGKGGQFDILPVVVSIGMQEPQFFELPEEYKKEVVLQHPEYPNFVEAGLKWYTVPAVSNMMFDVGGIQFPASVFSGCYMNTEIARNLCDSNRYNVMESLAGSVFGLDTSKTWNLWKDRVFLEVNRAVLYSFQTSNITVIDHHSASESFVRHMQNEQRLRGGCPADWIWIVPPLGGSLLSVFHQEMLDYRLTPSLSYQPEPWAAYFSRTAKRSRYFTLRQIAKLILFSTKLMRTARARRVPVTILYATETGKSERYARSLGDLFSRAFDAKVASVEHYDCLKLDEEKLLIIVASTFGNGDPPDSGKAFGSYLQGRVEPLHQLRSAVFGVGSSAYPQFCTFARQIDRSLTRLGADCILPIHTGDEVNGQDRSFKEWATEIYEVACDEFGIADSATTSVSAMSERDNSWSRGTARLLEGEWDDEFKNPQHVVSDALGKTHRKDVKVCTLIGKENLQSDASTRQTLRLTLQTSEPVEYEPGDHLSVFVHNDPVSVRVLLTRLGVEANGKALAVETSNNGGSNTWRKLNRLPALPLELLLAAFLDITTPPSQTFLSFLSELASNLDERERLTQLSQRLDEYENWKRCNWPSLVEVLDYFPSIQLDVSLLLMELPLLQPRFYSISSSPLTKPNQIELTVAILTYVTKNGNGPLHCGVASTHFSSAPIGQPIYYYLRRTPSFHLPKLMSTTTPVYMIGAGSGIAPFRGFWQHLERRIERPEVTLIFGCRDTMLDHIYEEEIDELRQKAVIKHFHLALSRERGQSKIYVQNVIPTISEAVFTDLTEKGAHVYVCGDVGMATGVLDAIKDVCVAKGMPEVQAAKFLDKLRADNRYHEDIFGTYKSGCGYLCVEAH
ncbi:Nitric oxide synthase, brain [Hypsibius exemplaris]|uniref:Nitric oxide synthase n=1 Tax=Hypsibius exemplaris TaxID=2072580 RepID=A0A1W0WE96_HYPEX|nr:Nitric oxide synthase, brain [Hypsibius exemplaris]